MEMANTRMVLLFDGVCNLCDGVVQFIIKRDPKGNFKFASLQSTAGQAILRQLDLPTDSFETFVLLEGDRYYTRSTAALRIARKLPGAWPLLYSLIVVPKPARDWFYRLVAKHRYRLFGRRDYCILPTPALKARFLDE